MESACDPLLIGVSTILSFPLILICSSRCILLFNIRVARFLYYATRLLISQVQVRYYFAAIYSFTKRNQYKRYREAKERILWNFVYGHEQYFSERLRFNLLRPVASNGCYSCFELFYYNVKYSRSIFRQKYWNFFHIKILC